LYIFPFLYMYIFRPRVLISIQVLFITAPIMTSKIRKNLVLLKGHFNAPWSQP
jgi:hypothetical protein